MVEFIGMFKLFRGSKHKFCLVRVKVLCVDSFQRFDLTCTLLHSDVTLLFFQVEQTSVIVIHQQRNCA